MKQILFFDTETCGLPPKGARWDANFEKFPNVVELAWYFNGRARDYIIKPDGWVIPEEASKIHGITTEMAIELGFPFDVVLGEFISDADKAWRIVCHNIYFDTSAIKANALQNVKTREMINRINNALDKGKRIDTMRASVDYVGAVHPNGKQGKFPSLKELYAKITEG